MFRRLSVLCVILLVIGAVTAAAQVPVAPRVPAIRAMVKAPGLSTYLALECTGPYTQFPAMEKRFLSEFKASRQPATGPEIAVYWNSPLYVPPEQLKWDIGYPVTANTKNAGTLVVKKFPYQKVAAVVHVGPYLTTYHTINALYDWIAASGLKTVGGPCVERYLDPDPDRVPDAQKRTEILIPVQ
ncbi:MAG: GyrI-like domain-containing protein [Candidatus Riflebacteria bacterium]|nr:GyrI-like domain-containing protein [Candidatus Riflebacteria bacterium]